jgi:Nickel responsive protein SCO4226-like
MGRPLGFTVVEEARDCFDPTPRQEDISMDLYAIRRRNGWQTPEELQETAGRSKQVGDDEMPDEVRWIRSYVVGEGNGALGTICVYQAVSPEALRTHAERVGMPADEIYPVLDTVLVRPDPQPATR